MQPSKHPGRETCSLPLHTLFSWHFWLLVVSGGLRRMEHFNIQSDTVLLLLGVATVIYGTGLIGNRTKSYHIKMGSNSASQWLLTATFDWCSWPANRQMGERQQKHLCDPNMYFIWAKHCPCLTSKADQRHNFHHVLDSDVLPSVFLAQRTELWLAWQNITN